MESYFKKHKYKIHICITILTTAIQLSSLLVYTLASEGNIEHANINILYAGLLGTLLHVIHFVVLWMDIIATIKRSKKKDEIWKSMLIEVFGFLLNIFAFGCLAISIIGYLFS